MKNERKKETNIGNRERLLKQAPFFFFSEIETNQEREGRKSIRLSPSLSFALLFLSSFFAYPLQRREEKKLIGNINVSVYRTI